MVAVSPRAGQIFVLLILNFSSLSPGLKQEAFGDALANGEGSQSVGHGWFRCNQSTRSRWCPVYRLQVWQRNSINYYSWSRQTRQLEGKLVSLQFPYLFSGMYPPSSIADETQSSICYVDAACVLIASATLYTSLSDEGRDTDEQLTKQI